MTQRDPVRQQIETAMRSLPPRRSPVRTFHAVHLTHITEPGELRNNLIAHYVPRLAALDLSDAELAVLPNRAMAFRPVAGRRVAHELAELVRALRSKDRQSIEHCTAELHETTIVALARCGLLRHELINLSDAEIAQIKRRVNAAAAPARGNGAPTDLHARMVNNIAGPAFEDLTGKPAGTSYNEGVRTGPYVRFLAQLYDILHVNAKAGSRAAHRKLHL